MDVNGDGVVSHEEWEAFCLAELHATASPTGTQRPPTASHLDDIDDS